MLTACLPHAYHTWAQRMEQLDRRKTKLREQALVVRSEVKTFDSFNSAGYGLSRECPEEHSSGLNFGSSLAYEDLRKAHTETVIPVTHEDYEAVRKYKNMNELQMSRDVDRRTFNYSETAGARTTGTRAGSRFGRRECRCRTRLWQNPRPPRPCRMLTTCLPHAYRMTCLSARIRCRRPNPR